MATYFRALEKSEVPGTGKFSGRIYALPMLGGGTKNTGRLLEMRVGLTPFRTAAPFWGQSTWNLTGLSPLRDCGFKRVNSLEEGIVSDVFDF